MAKRKVKAPLHDIWWNVRVECYKCWGKLRRGVLVWELRQTEEVDGGRLLRLMRPAPYLKSSNINFTNLRNLQCPKKP